MTYHLVVHGCAMNHSDAERLRTVLNGTGLRETDDERSADVLGVVACAVRQKATDRVYDRAHKWNDLPHRSRRITFVTGCVLPLDRKKLDQRFDLSFPIDRIHELPTLLAERGMDVDTPAASGSIATAFGERPAGESPPPSDRSGAAAVSATAGGRERQGTAIPFGDMSTRDRVMTGQWDVPPTYASSFDAVVPIQNGCNKFCTYCAVPFTRGREVSRRSDEIVAEVEGIIEAGYRSITLLGQNVNSYGQDTPDEVDFATLLRRIGAAGERVGRPHLVYFTSPHPRDMTDDVLEAIAEYPTLAKQIHLPLQSGDDEILKRMNRKHTMGDYARIVDSIRRILPSATLFTDIIVGFPGESRRHFESTLRAMETFAFNMAYIAIYSPRPGTAAAAFADDVPHEEKHRRHRKLSDVLVRTSSSYNRALIGKRVSVLVDGRDRKSGFFAGRTEGRIVARIAEEGVDRIGDFAEIDVTGAASLSIEGTFVADTPAGI